MVPGVSSFICSGFGSFIVNNNPITNDAALIKKINLRSFAIPAAAMPASHPNA